MIYAVFLLAGDANEKLRSALPGEVVEAMDRAAARGKPTAFTFQTEPEASTFVHSFFPACVASRPIYAPPRGFRVNGDNDVMRIIIFRDLTNADKLSLADGQVRDDAQVDRGMWPVAIVEASPGDHVEAANMVMRSVLPFDFNLWMPPEQAQQVAEFLTETRGPAS